MIDEAPVILCGFPSPAEDYRENTLDFNEYLNLDRPTVFVLRAEGLSMLNAGILPGDIIIVDRAKEATNGALVVASIDGSFTLKRLLIKGKSVTLKSENPDYSDIHLSSLEELVVFGVVTAVVRKL